VARAVETPRLGDNGVNVRRSIDVFDEVRVGEGRGEVQVRGETNRRIPAMGNEARAVLLRHPTDAPLLRDASDFGHVWLDDVEGASL